MQSKPLHRRDVEQLDQGRLVVSGRHFEWFRTLGLRTASDFLNLSGEIISGHPSRHVMRLHLGNRPCYLKKQHQTSWRERWKNAVSGFGFITTSMREATLLDELAQRGLPVPAWLAAGEISDGRAFLLVDALPHRISLRDLLERQPPRDRSDITLIVHRIATTIATMHALGVSQPDLVAKHILLDEDLNPAMIDWARGRLQRGVSLRQRARDIAALHASIRPEILPMTVRRYFLAVYQREAGIRRGYTMRFIRWIEKRSRQLERRTSYVEQRLPKVRESQNLFWEAGERLCVSELGRQLLKLEELWSAAYPSDLNANLTTRHQWELTPGCKVSLYRRRTILGIADRIRRAMSGRGYLAPECRQAAELLRLERLGQPRRLLAFGQWERQPNIVDSFIAYANDEREVDAGGWR